MSAFSDSLNEARTLLNSGNFNKAYTRICQEQPGRPDQLFNQLSIMANAAVALGHSEYINNCIFLLEKRERDILAIPTWIPYHWFNLANLYANFLAVCEAKGAPRPWFDRNRTALAREAYRRAAENSDSDKSLKSAINSAHARLLVGLGRDKEAFGKFHMASELDRSNHDAELGRIEMLVALSGTAPSLEKILLMEAGGKLVLKEQDGIMLNENWDEVIKIIRSKLGEKHIQEPDYPKHTVETRDDREHQIIMHTLKNNLYLTPCTMCRSCDRAIGDAEVLGAGHALIDGSITDRYRHTARLTGRLAERHRALRTAIIDCIRNKEKPIWRSNEVNLHHIPDLEGWKPAEPIVAALISILSGSSVMLEGMAACTAFHIGLDFTGMEQMFGTPDEPGEVKKSTNPALHGFWDLWADGMEGTKVPAIMGLSKSMSSGAAEELLVDTDKLIDAALAWTSWLGLLISQLVRMADRDARGETDTPPLWPLQPFRIPSDS